MDISNNIMDVNNNNENIMIIEVIIKYKKKDNN